MYTARHRQLGLRPPVKLRIAKWVVGIGFLLILVASLQLICTIQATKVLDYKNEHSFKPVH